MYKSYFRAPRIRELLTSSQLETGFSMLEAVVVVGVLLALAIGGLFSYGAITQNAKIAAVKSAASSTHTAVVVASTDGDINTKPENVISDWNNSTDKIKVEILPPSIGTTSTNGDFCVKATNQEDTTIFALEGSCVGVIGGSVGGPVGSDPTSSPTSSSTPTTPGGTTGGNTGGTTGGNTYTATGPVPVGYTYNVDFTACPAPFADAVKARILADGSQTYFNASYYYYIDKTAESDAAWNDYYALDGVYSDLYSAMSSSQQKIMSNFSSYVSDVPGYSDLESTFWNTPNQADFNLMSEEMASAVPTFCNAVKANTGTLKCHAETQNYLLIANAYYHKWMYENERYSANPTTANYNSWSTALATYNKDPQLAIDDKSKDDAYNAMIAAVGGEWEVQNAQNMKKQELDASWNNFVADTSRTNYDLWVDLEYPVNACR